MKQYVGTTDILFITLDTLRFDVAQRAFEQSRLPTLSRWLPRTGWQARHSPANFTFAAHQAFFAGFLPTPLAPGIHPRLFAAEFLGSETTTTETFVFEQDNIVAALAARSYTTICIGGVGFFNKQTALGRVLPDMFQQSFWSPEMGVAHRDSTQFQCEMAVKLIQEIPDTKRVFMFVNVSAMHQPNYFYLKDASVDSTESQLEAFCYADGQLAILFDVFCRRGNTFCIVCSDHGTAYGEDGYTGHRLNHPVVGTVPYAEFLLTQQVGER